MTVKLQRAAVSQKLIAILVLTLIVAGGYWVVRWRSSTDMTTSGPYTIYCPTCGKQEVAKHEWEGTKFLCPECKKYTASSQDPSIKPPPGTNLAP